ncbi:MAG: hypothetical protein NTV21_19910 [Planctomycetota bacterium]|nr:hypothetical protein [Planctomycetota bacterium]
MGAPATFAGRVLSIATLHGKERALAPALTAALGLERCVVAAVDTDRFGAFSGEITRVLEPRAAAEAKARAALAEFGGDLALASEGSFVPYPPAPLLTLDEEWLVLVDARHGRVFAHRHATLEAVFAGRRCTSLEALLEFVRTQPFPEHSLVLRPRERWSTGHPVSKGVRSREELELAAQALLARFGELWVETDLRAHHNPTRMRAIAAAASEFAAELATPCPRCAAPHFRIARSLPGLPCSGCGEPTDWVRARVRACDPCGHELELPRPDGRTAADPGSCGACNP